MKKGLTEIVLVVDKSGSMASVRNKTISGLKEFLTTQKQLPGSALLTLITFSDRYSVDIDGKNLTEINESVFDKYVTAGLTALYDAIGVAIDSVGKRLAATPEDDRPEKVMVVILTDGEENSSKEYGLDLIKDMIDRQKQIYSWEFVFLGADIDAMATGDKLRMSSSVSMDKSDMHANLKKMSFTTAVYRSSTADYKNIVNESDGLKNIFSMSSDDLDKKIKDLSNGGK